MEQIPREANKVADYLAKIVFVDLEKGLFYLAPILELKKPSYEDEDQVYVVKTVENIEQEEENW